MSKVYLALQDNDDARYIVEAIEADNPGAVVQRQPAMIRIENNGRLVIRKASVEDTMGREWALQELHLSLITLGGNVSEDEDEMVLHWN